MNQYLPALAAMLAATTFFGASAAAQDATPPATVAEREAGYTLAIEKRADAILAELALSDPVKSARVHDVIIAQYRALRARDEAMDAKLKAQGKEAAARDKDLASQAPGQSKALHDQFIANLSKDLTPQQIEKVKDKMTYNKVKVTYDAYCAIVPGLTEKDKVKILELLKDAREEAIDGGSANAKSATFQKYKDQINAYLVAQGHDVAKAYKDWDARQELARKQKEESAPKTAPAAQ